MSVMSGRRFWKRWRTLERRSRLEGVTECARCYTNFVLFRLAKTVINATSERWRKTRELNGPGGDVIAVTV
jgi:hypothetical protein